MCNDAELDHVDTYLAAERERDGLRAVPDAG